MVKKYTKTTVYNKAKNKPVLSGYTITEVMIFLAVSSVILVSALALVGPLQSKTRFSQSVRQIQSVVEDIINDNETGLYLKNNDFSCSAGASGTPTINTLGSSEHGQNLGCVFLGKALQFSPGGDGTEYSVHTVVGRQFVGDINSQVVTSYVNAKPISITGNIATEQLEEGLEVRKMTYESGGAVHNASTVAFLADLGQYSHNSANVRTRLTAFKGNLDNSHAAAAGQIKDLGDSGQAGNHAQDVPVKICFLSGTTAQYAILSIALNQGQLSTELEIFNGESCP